MKKKIDRAITRKLDDKFDKKFWNKFDDKFSENSHLDQSPWSQLLRPVIMASILILLTVNLYNKYGGSSLNEQFLTESEIEQIVDVNMEVDDILDSMTLEFDDDFYALND